MARVLVVEDDPDIRSLLEVRLVRMGHLVVAVGSGEEALAVVADRGAPDVAVLDVVMPGMSGLDLLTALRLDDACSAMPAVFLSGRIQPADIDAGQAMGARYLTKPVVLSALSDALEQALNSRAAAASRW